MIDIEHWFQESMFDINFNMHTLNKSYPFRTEMRTDNLNYRKAWLSIWFIFQLFSKQIFFLFGHLPSWFVSPSVCSLNLSYIYVVILVFTSTFSLLKDKKDFKIKSNKKIRQMKSKKSVNFKDLIFIGLWKIRLDTKLDT